MTATTLERTETEALAVVEHNALVLPVAQPNELVAAMHQYEATKKAILATSDYQEAEHGKRFIKRSGWAKLAIAFGVSSSIKSKEYERDEQGNLTSAEFVVTATAPNGRSADGWGACSIHERRFEKAQARMKVNHDLPATAETRARNRAYANLFGHGEVSAEEMKAYGSDVIEGEVAPARQLAPAHIEYETDENNGDIPSDPMTEKQSKMVFVLSKKLGDAGVEFRRPQRPLSKQEASAYIEYLDGEKQKAGVD